MLIGECTYERRGKKEKEKLKGLNELYSIYILFMEEYTGILIIN